MVVVRERGGTVCRGDLSDSSDICDTFGVVVITNLALCDNAFSVGIVTYLNMEHLQCICSGNCNVLEYGTYLT